MSPLLHLQFGATTHPPPAAHPLPPSTACGRSDTPTALPYHLVVARHQSAAARRSKEFSFVKSFSPVKMAEIGLSCPPLKHAKEQTTSHCVEPEPKSTCFRFSTDSVAAGGAPASPVDRLEDHAPMLGP
jgi:hypothetical protein